MADALVDTQTCYSTQLVGYTVLCTHIYCKLNPRFLYLLRSSLAPVDEKKISQSYADIQWEIENGSRPEGYDRYR